MQARLLSLLLYLIGLLLVLMGIKIFGGLVMSLPMVSPELWATSKPGHLLYHPLSKYLLLFQIGSRLALLYLMGLASYSLLKQRRTTPLWMVVFLVSYLLALLTERGLTYIIFNHNQQWFVQAGFFSFTTTELLFVLFNCMVWIPLFLVSTGLRAKLSNP
jgi:hypothetical protein